MNTMGATVLVLFALPWAAIGDSQGSRFLGRKMSTASIRAELQGVLHEVLGHGHGVDVTRLARIRKVLTPMFLALPKNHKGKLAAPVMRYTVRRYFSQQHAWIVKGFEPHADIVNISSGQDEDILQGKVPDFIRSVLESQFKHEGFALEDTVAMVAALERLAFDEVVRSIELAFYLNALPMTSKLTRQQLMDVMSSYLIIEMLEGTDDKEQHIADKEHILERYPNWDGSYMFLVDVVSSDIFQRRNSLSPFVEEEAYNFEDAARIAELVSEQFGPWSNHECHEMRDLLTEFDVHNTGRVRVADFYRSTAEGAWQFLEPTQFLRQNGALDESSTYLGPQVIIANYIAGMSNCITSAPYYSICCLNECDHVFQHIEAHVTSPIATPEKIMAAVESVPQGANISPQHHAWLSDIASLHSGQVPIHGRLLAQWLHYVFPHECPYPHTGGLTPKTQEQWRAQVGEDAESVSEDEVIQHLEAEYSRRTPSSDAGKEMWVLQETLLDFNGHSGAAFAHVMRMAAQIGMIACFGALVVDQIRRVMAFPGSPRKSVEHDV